MDPLSIALALGQYVPDIIKWLGGSKKQEDVATKVIEIAKKVTGSDDPISAVSSNPELAAALQTKIIEARLEEARIDLEALKEVNATIRAESSSDHWPTYSWRPFIGFSFGFYLNSLWLLPLFSKTPVTLTPDAVLAIGGILGVASWFRGKMQADPNKPSDNRG